jgi:hypothetical protein
MGCSIAVMVFVVGCKKDLPMLEFKFETIKKIGG